MKNLTLKNTKKQHGAVLVMALLMLFVLTLIGVSGMNTTTMEEKMSGNTRNRQLAFQSAESAVRAAERLITLTVNNPIAQFSATGTNGMYSLGNGPSSTDAVNNAWWSALTTTKRIEYPSTIQDITSKPVYTIEYLGETTQSEANDIEIHGGEGGTGGQGSIHTFRVTARGTGLTNNSVVVIQSHFGKRI